MANARLLVEVAATLATFQADLGKAAAIVEREARKIESSFSGIGNLFAKAFGAAAAAFSVAGIVSWAKETISAAAALDDLADSTGSTVESLSKLQNQARISGVDFGTLQGLMLKLTAGMAGVEEEGSKTGRALAALGISSRDPAEALQLIAVELNKYADGIGKAALARDLFGKGGPAFLSTLKDMAQMQDVVATVTTKQAAEAEKLEQALRRLSVESHTFKDTLLSAVVPALVTAIEQFNLARQAGLGFWKSFQAAGIDSEQDLGPSIERQTRNIQKLREQLEAENKKPAGASRAVLMERQLREEERILATIVAVRGRALALRFGDTSLSGFGDMRDVALNRKPVLDYTGAKEAKDGKAGVDEFARALDSVSKMAAVAKLELHGVFATEEITSAQRALAALQADDSWAKFTENQKTTIRFAYEGVIAIQQETAEWKKKREETQKQIKVFEDIAAAQQKAKESFTQTLGNYAEANDTFARQIELIGADDLARQKLVATIEYERLRKQALAADDTKGLEILDEQYARRLKLLELSDATVKRIQDEIDIARVFQDSFSGAFTELITGAKSFADAFKSMERSIVAGISRIAANKISDALFGSVTGGGGGTALLEKLLGLAGRTLFGGGLSGGDAAAAGFPGGGYASGTDFARGGPVMVGERGPEIVNLPRGSTVTPNNKIGGNVIHINQSFAGDVSRATIDQVAVRTGAAVRRAMARNS